MVHDRYACHVTRYTHCDAALLRQGSRSRGPKRNRTPEFCRALRPRYGHLVAGWYHGRWAAVSYSLAPAGRKRIGGWWIWDQRNACERRNLHAPWTRGAHYTVSASARYGASALFPSFRRVGRGAALHLFRSREPSSRPWTHDDRRLEG